VRVEEEERDDESSLDVVVVKEAIGSWRIAEGSLCLAKGKGAGVVPSPSGPDTSLFFRVRRGLASASAVLERLTHLPVEKLSS
jgi:hypothetical protein